MSGERAGRGQVDDTAALLAWRLVRPAYADPAAAFSGEGARLFGGRWNTPGRPVVYASLHLSLAALENLAHADRRRFERDYVVFEVHVPHQLILELRDEDVPDDWRARPVSAGARTVGDAWLEQRASVALTVPSVLVPQERNLLLDPAHPRFAEVHIGSPQGFRFDERLVPGGDLAPLHAPAADGGNRRHRTRLTPVRAPEEPPSAARRESRRPVAPHRPAEPRS